MPTGETLAEFNGAGAEKMHEQQLSHYVITETGCWNWTKSTSPDGYGKLKRNGVTMRAHRIFYEHFNGPITDNLHVLHRCDNPLCVNPEHLFLGTRVDNMQDMIEKGRAPTHPSISHPESVVRGEKHHRYGKGMPEHVKEALLKANKGRSLSKEHKEQLSPVTAEQVLSIRADTRSQAVIAKEHGIAQVTVSRIKRRVRWTHI